MEMERLGAFLGDFLKSNRSLKLLPTQEALCQIGFCQECFGGA